MEIEANQNEKIYASARYRMSGKCFGLLCAFLFCLIGSGCTSVEPAKEHIEVMRNTEQTDNLGDQEKSNQSKIMVIEEAPKDSKSPSEAATHQYKLIMANGEEKVMTQAEVVNEVVLGDVGWVLLDTRKYDNNFILMVYEKSSRWEASSVFEIDYQNGEQYEEAGGISLPFDSFVIASQTESNPEIWAFSNGEEVVTIAEYKDDEFSDDKNVRVETSPGGKQLFVSKEPDKSYLYYEASGYLVVISGTINLDDMKKLADSMDTLPLSSVLSKSKL